MNGKYYSGIRISTQEDSLSKVEQIIVPKDSIVVERVGDDGALVIFLYGRGDHQNDRIVPIEPYSYFLAHLTGESVPQQPLRPTPTQDWEFGRAERNVVAPSAEAPQGTTPESRD